MNKDQIEIGGLFEWRGRTYLCVEEQVKDCCTGCSMWENPEPGACLDHAQCTEEGRPSRRGAIFQDITGL